MLVDERFQSSMESEEQCHWLPVQVLNAVHNTATLPDGTQVDVMKVSVSLELDVHADTHKVRCRAHESAMFQSIARVSDVTVHGTSQQCSSPWHESAMFQYMARVSSVSVHGTSQRCSSPWHESAVFQSMARVSDVLYWWTSCHVLLR